MREIKLSQSEFQKIPDWVIKYDQAGHQSGAGKAVRLLMESLSREREKTKLVIEALERIQIICFRESISDEQMQCDFKLIFEITDDTLLKIQKI